MKIENVFSLIKEKSVEEHEKELQNKMFAVELQYVDNLFLKKIPPLEKDTDVSNLKELISKYTEISSKIMKYRDGDANEKELFDLKEEILNKISEFYKEDYSNWIEKSEKLIDESLKKYKDLEKNENKNEQESNHKAGLISFSMETNRGHLLPGSGISDDDLCLGIHFDDLYKQKKEDTKNVFSSNSLEKLALTIIEKHPEAKAVVGESWLMDTPIAERIGFTIYDRDLYFRSGPFWGQFIDSNGQIKKDEVSKFLETGNPKYRIAIGAMKVEDFLKKYLPQDRKGKVILKDQTLESKNFIKDLNRISKEFNEKWEEMSYEDAVSLVNSNDIFENYFKTPEGQAYLDMLKKAKELNLDKNSLKGFNYENQEIIKENFKKFVEENKNKFTDKEVII